MKWISVVIFLCAFLLMRPYDIQDNGLLYTGDDESYFAHATSIVYGQFPSYDKEYFTLGDQLPEHPIGASLMAVPFVYAFSWIDRWAGSSIVDARTKKNISSSWSLFGFVVATSVYFWFACFFLFRGLRIHVGYFSAVWAIIFMILVQGIPLYVFRRPVFSHVYWLFLESVMMYFLFKNGPGNFCRTKDWLKPLGLGLLLGLMVLTRHNNILMVLLWPLVLVGAWPLSCLKTTWSSLLKVYLSAGILICSFSILLFLSHIPGADAAQERLFAFYTPDFYLKRLVDIFWGMDWGLVYLQPFFVVGLIWLFRLDKKDVFRKGLLLLASAAFVNLYIVMLWKTQASYYGYRYLIFSLIPLLIYPLAAMIEQGYKRWGYGFMMLGSLLAVFPFLAMLLFEATATTGLTAYQNGWGNQTYIIEVFKYFSKPVEAWIPVICKAGFYYWEDLLSRYWGWLVPVELPFGIYFKYLLMEPAVFYKTVVLYLIPFFFLGLFWKFEK